MFFEVDAPQLPLAVEGHLIGWGIVFGGRDVHWECLLQFSGSTAVFMPAFNRPARYPELP